MIDQLNGFYLRNQIGTNDDLRKNKDGSGTLYTQNESPCRDKESNWVQTVSGKGWNIILRLYGPLQPWFNKTWRLGEIELVKQTRCYWAGTSSVYQHINGRSEVAAVPGSATMIKTFIFGKALYGDLDGDGDSDAAMVLVHDPGASGTFYYVAAPLSLNGRYRGTNAVLLGDRIIPRDITIRNGAVVAGYAERRSHEPMRTAASVDRSIYLTLKNGKLTALNLLGESDFHRSLGWEAELGFGGSRSDSITPVTCRF